MVQIPENLVLRVLSPGDLAVLMRRAIRLDLVYDKDVFRPNDAVSRVIFPELGVISIITEAASGEGAEAGIVGVEGAAGLLEALGTGVMAARGTVQRAGRAWSVDAADCRSLFESSPRFRRAVVSCGEFQVTEARLSMLCRSHHALEKRLARWLLEMSDRAAAQGDQAIALTQEHLSLMLGVQRTTLSHAAAQLRERGVIDYQRGRITIADARVLETKACACRATLLEDRKRFIAHLEG